VSVLSFNYSWNSEGKTFVLCRRELQGIVCIQVYGEPYKNNYAKHDKAGAVVDRCKKGQQKKPEGSVISHPN